MIGRPLAGVLVVAVEQAVAVPFATRQLADLGARVIKIERPVSGDFARDYDTTVAGMSSAFVWLNRGKESIELDIASPEGGRVLDALLRRADVFLHNVSPGAARRHGIDSASLSRTCPRVISGSVSGYGSSGPMADAKAYDLLVQGETGLMSITGDDAHYAKVGISIADIAAGMYVYASVLAALHHRERTGEILTVDVSLFDSLTEWLGYPLQYTRHGGIPPRRMGTNHATIAPYGAFAAADGEQILLAVQNGREWERFCIEVLRDADRTSDPRFESNSKRVAHRTELDALISACLGVMDHRDVARRLEAAGIAHARLRSIQELGEHEQLAGRDRWVDTVSEVGPVQTVLPPWVPVGHDLAYGPVPALGQHTQQILSWLRVPQQGEEP